MKRDAYVVVKELFDAEIEDAEKSILSEDRLIDYWENELFKVNLIDALVERLDDKDPKKGPMLRDFCGARMYIEKQISAHKEKIKSLYMHIFMIKGKRPVC